MIYKKLLILSAVAVVSYATTNFNFVNSQAALTRPANYALGYFQNPVSADWLLTKKTGGTTILNPGYVRSGTSPNYTYTTGLGGTGWDDTDFPNTIPIGLTINMIFRNSNTNWVAGGFGIYYPSGGGQIGSNNQTGTAHKHELNIVNNSPKDYRLFLDTSGVGEDRSYLLRYNNQPFGHWYEYHNVIWWEYTTFYVPAFSSTIVKSEDSSRSMFLSGFYLEDLGDNPAYTQGYDNGYGAGYDNGVDYGYGVGYEQGEAVGLEQGYPVGYADGFDDGIGDGMAAMPIQSLFTAIFGGIAQIFNINIFGAITLGTIILAPIAVALLWFILGIISGVGGKK
jgi:hypothetical protein